MTEPLTPLKKVSLAFDAELLEVVGYAGFAEYLASIENLDKLRAPTGETFYIAKIVVKESVKSLHEFGGKFGVEEFHVIHADHPEYVVFYHLPTNPFLMEVLQELEFDVYFTHPEYYDGEHYVMSFYTHQSTLVKIFQLLKDLGVRFRVIAVSGPGVSGKYLLRTFSQKQLEMLVTAYKQGYYDIPRRVKVAELAEAVGTSVQMVHKHLRRAERKLVAEVLGDYILED